MIICTKIGLHTWQRSQVTPTPTSRQKSTYMVNPAVGKQPAIKIQRTHFFLFDSVAPFYLMLALLSCFLLQFLFLIDMSCKIRGIDLYNLWVEKKGKLWEIAFLYLLVFKSFWVSTSFLRVCVCARVRVWCVCACAHACMFDLSSEEQMQESSGTLSLGRLDIVTA